MGPRAIGVNLLTVVSMVVRNLVLLAIFSFPAGLLALCPIVAMAGAALLVARKQQRGITAAPGLQLGSPVELKKVASIGVLFVFIQTAGSLAQKLLGSSGTILVSLFGGLAQREFNGRGGHAFRARPDLTARSGNLYGADSVASMMVNLPIVYRQFRDRDLIRRLAFMSGGIALVGGVTMAAVVFIVGRFGPA